jgi:hypothetical protein
MKSKYTEKYREQAAEYLEPGEQVLSACIAQPHGRTLAMVGGGAIDRGIGQSQVGKASAAAEQAGLLVEGPMAIAVTNQRVATFKISAPVLGRGGNIKEMLSAIPLAAVDNWEYKKFGMKEKTLITVGGTEVKLEGAAGGKELHEAYQQAKAG